MHSTFLCFLFGTLFLNSTIYFNPNLNDVIEKETKVLFSNREADGILNCYDVSEDGYIAVGYDNHNINIYNNDLEFVYALNFERAHSTQVISWENDVLVIYRKNDAKFEVFMIYGMDNADVYEMSDTKENDELWQNVYQIKMRSNIEMADYGYQVQDGKLLRINKKNGFQEVIAQDSKVDAISWNFTGILFFVSFTACFIYEQSQKTKKSKKR